MKKNLFWKSSILLLVGVAALLLSTITVSAITLTDGEDDVIDGATDTFVSRPNIDVTTVTCELSGNTVTLTMTVKGSIIDSEYIKYTIWTDSDLISSYGAQYWNGDGYVLKDSDFIDSEFSISQGNTIIFTFTKSDTVEITEVVGSAKEDSEDYSNHWIDNAFGDYPGDDDDDEIPPDGDDTESNSNGDDDEGTPGFEVIAVIAAIIVALIILKKRK